MSGLITGRVGILPTHLRARSPQLPTFNPWTKRYLRRVFRRCEPSLHQAYLRLGLTSGSGGHLAHPFAGWKPASPNIQSLDEQVSGASFRRCGSHQGPSCRIATGTRDWERWASCPPSCGLEARNSQYSVPWRRVFGASFRRCLSHRQRITQNCDWDSRLGAVGILPTFLRAGSPQLPTFNS